MKPRLIPGRRLLAGAALVTLAVGLVAGPAAADSVMVRSVDTRDFPVVRLGVRVDGAPPAMTDFHLRENGVVVADSAIEVHPLKQTANPVGTVLVVDTSGSMRSEDAIGRAKAAARRFIEGKAPNEWIAVVSFSDQATVASPFTQDGAALAAAVDGLQATGETALWDGLVAATGLYRNRPDLQANLVLLSDGADSVSKTTRSDAIAAATGAHAAVFAVALRSVESDPAGLAELAGASGGSLATSSDVADLDSQFARIRVAIENQYEIRYTSAGDGGALALDLTVGDLSTVVQTRAGSAGAAATPVAAAPGGGPFSGAGVRYLAVALAGLAAGLTAFALLRIFGRREASVEELLGPYATAPVSEESPGGGSLVETGLVQRAVDLTSRVASRGGLLARVEALLEQASLPLRPAEALFFYGAGTVLVTALALFSAPNPLVGLTVAALAAAAPVLTLRARRRRRQRQFQAQLPETLNLLSGALRAGYSFLQGLDAVARETSEPMARELRRALAESQLGRPMEEALEDIAVRMDSPDFGWCVIAIGIQREVGGNLAELLQTVADTMVQRVRMRGEIKALTAEGRISGIVMGLLPVGIGLFILTASPGYLQPLFHSAAGLAMVGVSTLMAMAGYAWIQKIIKIEV